VNDSVYGRLRRVARELGTEVPCVSSIVELAAEGNAEAISRVIELCRASEGDETARDEVSTAMVEVTRTAPEELLMALQAAPAADQEAVVARLAHGLAKASDPNHPVWSTLRKMANSGTEGVVAFVKRTEASLTTKIEQEKEPKPSPSPSADAPKPGASGAEPRPGG